MRMALSRVVLADWMISPCKATISETSAGASALDGVSVGCKVLLISGSFWPARDGVGLFFFPQLAMVTRRRDNQPSKSLLL